MQSCAVDDGHLRLSLAGADRPGSVDQLAAAISATLDCPVAITIAYAPTVIKTSAP